MIISISAHDKRYEDFIMSHPNGHIFQSEEWSDIKALWEDRYIVAEDESGIRGAACVRIRRLGASGFSVMYMARGPICDYNDRETIQAILGAVDSIASDENAIEVKLDPAIPANESAIFTKAANEMGFSLNSSYYGFEALQSRFMWRVPLGGKSESEVFSAFAPKTRYNIRLALKRGVTVRKCGRESINTFYGILRETAERDGFSIRDISYFYNMYDRIVPNMGGLVLAFHEGKCVAGALYGVFAGLGEYLYGATSSHDRKCMGAYLVQWSVIRELIRLGAHTYDMRGVPGKIDENDPLYGLYRFKKGFGGEVHEFVGEYRKAYRPMLGKVFDLMLKARREVSHLLRVASASHTPKAPVKGIDRNETPEIHAAS